MEEQKNNDQRADENQNQEENPEPRSADQSDETNGEGETPRPDARGRGGEKGGSGAGDIGHGTGGGMMVPGGISLQDQEAEEKFGKGSKQDNSGGQPAHGTE